MGEHNISMEMNSADAASFMRQLLADLKALELMLKSRFIESDICRIGAEQEIFFVDKAMRPACIASEVLAEMEEPRFTTELGKFNLEANLTPLPLSANCFHRMESELTELILKARNAAEKFGAGILLTGILPTMRLNDLTLQQMTEAPRYFLLNRMLSDFRRDNYFVQIKGVDEIQISHPNMMLEACNTSFQVHFQVDPARFPRLYNAAQLVSAPVLAAGVNSPLLFGKKLWSETRIALLEHSVDERSNIDQARERSPRVTFGNQWVKESILEIYREDIARFRVLFHQVTGEDPLEKLAQGRVPELHALRLHNGTVWRWNRPCYGILDGKPHIRIEVRALPSGPTIIDQVANAAFLIGLTHAVQGAYGEIPEVFSFENVKANFYAAARHGLDAQLRWLKGKSYPASELILKELIPLAKEGLLKQKVHDRDVDHYLGMIEDRVRYDQTGAHWIQMAFQASEGTGPQEIRLRKLTSRMLELQKSGKPVHEWKVPPFQSTSDYSIDYRTVGQFMSTDLYTVRPDDIIDYIASIMHWEHIRHLPVEDERGDLVGLVSQRDLLALLAQGSLLNRAKPVSVRSIMKTEIVTVTPETRTSDAIRLMRQNKIGCLPVVNNEKLVGILTTYDLLTAASNLLEAALTPSCSSS